MKMKIRKNNGSLSRGQKSNFPAMALGLSLAMAAPTLASTWDGEGGDGLWNTALNWDGNWVPASSDNVYIETGYTVEIQTNAPDIGQPLVLDFGGHLTINANLAHVASLNNMDVILGGIMTQGGGDVYFCDDMKPSATAVHNMNGGTFLLRDYYNTLGLLAITGGSFTVGASTGADGSYLQINGGTLKITGDAATITTTSLQAATGTLEIVLKDGGISTIDVTNNAALPGTLDVTLDGGFTPIAGDYTLISAGSLSGSLGTENLPSGDWSVATVGNDLVLTYAPTVSTSTAAITSITWGSPNATIDMTGVNGTTYTCDSSTDLVTWDLDVDTDPASIVPVEGVFSFDVAADAVKKFYRIAE
jgi:hypothetical protein